MIFSFGQSKHERIEVDVLRYERSPVGEFYDDNWLTVRVWVSAGTFRGSSDATFRAEELEEFLVQLRPLSDSLRGTAEFITLEEQLHLQLTGDGRGHIELMGEVADHPATGNRLNFTLQFDQSQLKESIRELEQVTAKFPVRTS